MSTEKKLIEDIGVVLQDVEQLIVELKGKTTKEFGEVQETLEGKLDRAKSMLINFEQDLLSKEKTAVEMSDSFVRSNVWKFLIMVALISYLIGYSTGW